MPSRPHSREQQSPSGSGSVYRRGSGTGMGGVGNGASGGGSSSQRSSSSYGGSSDRGPGGFGGFGGFGGKGGIGVVGILIVVVIFFVSRFMGGQGANTHTVEVDQGGGGIASFFNGGISHSTSSASDSGAVEYDTSVDPSARAKFTSLKGDGSDRATVMVYICGSNLESKSGLASTDIMEMVKSNVATDQVHVVLETGGAKRWQNDVIRSDRLGRFEVDRGGLKDLGAVSSADMTDPATLSDFIRFSAANYPADRYILILWDHGGGSVTGFGCDENYPGGSMDIAEIRKALQDGGVKIDILGFDACLMGSMENALCAEPCADYLLASEEIEPGRGWYYTDWLNDLAADPSMSSLEIGKNICDSYITTTAQTSPNAKATLSLVDLAEFSGTVPQRLSDFGSGISNEIEESRYKEVAKARSDTREFAISSRVDQIDLVNFCSNLGTSGADALSKAVEGCVKYNRTNNITNAYGMSAYFPYNSSKQGSMSKIYDRIDMNSEYADSVRSFARLEASGQIASSSAQGGSGSLIGSLFSSFTGSGSSSGGSTLGNLFSGGQSGGGISSLLMSALSGGRSMPDSSTDAVTEGFGAGYPSADMTYGSILGGTNDFSSAELESDAQYISDNYFNAADLKPVEKDEEYVISLFDEQWERVRTVELNVFVDDGEGYIDMGLDNSFRFNNDGDLIYDYDGTWIALDGKPVAYYLLTDEYDAATGSYEITGYVPAMIDGQRRNIILTFTDEEPKGYVSSVTEVDANGTCGKAADGIEAGDLIEPLCDYYSYDMEMDDTYYLGDAWTASGTPKVSTVYIENGSFLFGYRFTDYFNAHYWTPMTKD